jgi:hypothetical protein
MQNKAHGMRETGKTKTCSPPSKRLPATSPATSKWLFLGVCSLMSLNMFHTPNMRGQCKPIYKIEEMDGGCALRTDLNRLLQYLHGSALGFCCRVSPFSSCARDGGDASIDWSGSMACTGKLPGAIGVSEWRAYNTARWRRSHLAPVGEWGKGGRRSNSRGRAAKYCKTM